MGAPFSSAAESAADGPTPALHLPRPKAQPMAQPRGRLILGCRWRSAWRNRSMGVLFSAAEGATYGAITRRTFDSRRPRAQPAAQSTRGRLSLGGRWRKHVEQPMGSGAFKPRRPRV
eukprot:7847685-Pyramimonas_sp.AAC.1